MAGMFDQSYGSVTGAEMQRRGGQMPPAPPAPPMAEPRPAPAPRPPAEAFAPKPEPRPSAIQQASTGEQSMGMYGTPPGGFDFGGRNFTPERPPVMAFEPNRSGLNVQPRTYPINTQNGRPVTGGNRQGAGTLWEGAGTLWEEINRGDPVRAAVAGIGGFFSDSAAAARGDVDYTTARNMRAAGTPFTTQKPTAPAAPTAPQQPTYTTPNNSALNAFNRASTASMRDSVRPVDGAPGVLRYDRQGQSPLYSNVGGGDFRAGVLTIGAGDGAMAMERNNRAAEIYASMRQPQQVQPQRGGFLGGASGGIESPQNDSAALSERWGFENQIARVTNPMIAAALISARLQAQSGIDQANIRGQYGLQEADMRGQYGLQEADVRGQYGLQEADARAREARGLSDYEFNRGEPDRALDRQIKKSQLWQANAPRQLEPPQFNKDYFEALGDQGGTYLAELRNAQNSYAANMEKIQAALSSGMTLEQLMQDPESRAIVLSVYDFTPVQRKAEGGLVEDYGALQFARGGPVYGAAPNMEQVRPEVNAYQQYVMGAKALGLPPVSFDEFNTVRVGAQQVANAAPAPGAMRFNQGGPVPAAGKMVIDADPNAPIDSIPAVVDGNQPAALNSGEFVFPTDVVQFFGTDKLNKMIAAARQQQQPQG